MNDITILLPLPATWSGPPTLARMSDEGDLVPRTLFDRLVTDPGELLRPYDDFHLVAIRFDLCDRAAPGACPEGLDGRLRLVFQPLRSDFTPTTEAVAADVAMHAFYPIPEARLADVVAELRELSTLGGSAPDAPLAVNTAVTTRPDYAARLRGLVVRYARPDQLFRLTLFAQPDTSSSVNWVLRGVVRDGAGYADIAIPTVDATEQRVLLTGPPTLVSYDTTPFADAPAGLEIARSGQAFMAASPDMQKSALEVLAAVDNPAMHSAETVQCVACHVSTFLMAARSTSAGLAVQSLSSRFTSTYDLSIESGMSARNARSLRNLGWLQREPAISQRVANDTAQVLSEIEMRFPLAQ